MSLAPSVAVTGTAILALSVRAACRSLNITNNGTGTLLYNTVTSGSAATLTTGNGISVVGQGEVNNFPITPLGSGNPTGLDVYLISGSTTTASVQSVPI